MNKTTISHPTCKLGEVKGSYRDAPGFAQALQGGSMLDIPDMWGWGNYFRSEDIYALARQCAAETLDGAGVAPCDIDMVIYCGAMLPADRTEFYRRSADMLAFLGIENANVAALTLAGCATTLKAMIHASGLVAAGIYRNVLVLAMDVLPPDLLRFDKYAVFSDVCAAFLVNSASRGGYQIVSSAQHTSTAEMRAGINYSDPVLAKRSVARTMEQAAMRLSDVGKVFGNNLFLPIKMMKETAIGISRSQMDLSNVAKTGHCFSCDSLVNLLNHTAARAPAEQQQQQHYLLYAETDGHAAAVLLRTAGA